MSPRYLSVFVVLALVLAACGSDGTVETSASTDTVEQAPEVEDVEELPAAAEEPDEPELEAPAVDEEAGEPVEADAPAEPVEAEPTPTLSLELSSLPPLGEGGDYEVWLMDFENPTSIGTFDIEGEGTVELPLPADLGFEPTEVQISIETDTDPSRSDTVVLAGAIENGTVANLTTSFVGSFDDASGQYILATPTDGTGTPENERSGVWWTLIPREQSLFLPQLPAGWVYEGWQVIDGQEVTHGTFTNPFGEPDAAAPFSGPQAGPPLAGEDFLLNAPDGLTFPVDLRGTEVFISVEPFPDTGAESFTIVPLRGTVPSDAVDHVAYSVENTSGVGPAGTATLNLA